MKELSIILDKPKYRPGETINGVVCFLLGREKRLKRVRLHIQGKSQVKSTQNEDGTNVGSALISACEEYFEDSTLLVSTDAAPSTLASGQHSLPFKFHLPEGIPSSFEGNYGNVRYSFECCIISPLKATKSVRKTISIVNPIRLSDHPRAPVVRYESLGEEGDVPRSNVEVVKLTRSQKGSVDPGESEVWAEESLIVPCHLPASGLQHCSIIHVGYYLEMCVQPWGPFPALRIPSKTPTKPSEFNVIIGSEY
ncbi:hypothetical protein CAPTEDRAFT_219326 [Capitella teleta]|uniref:Arrestin-like N-terminal domain-containing protein n=1 Tax=Capitella teleta TaxID=283909 RepID=R7TF84_CAPTE|nr:hypothetical protein CAPTEDRAFT_219326 [Capitella teleta]|eukprot:ELT90211.1 hypothetical protein CAPTEDRAFT_219326 [Capitella teleta]